MLHPSSWRALVLLLLAACSTPEKTSTPPKPMDNTPPVTARPVDPAKVLAWERIQALIEEQKFQEALQATDDRLELAKGQRNEQEWTRALVQATQLQVGLHGYETAVRALMEQPWPSAPLHRATLHLFYAHSLAEYASAYQWEIRQRERVESQRKADLKAWTLDQLQEEIQRTYQEVWALREPLGNESVEVLKDYLQPNDYPRSVRGTLRDAVTYLRVQHLADTSFWRPEHQNELFRLDMPALVRAEPAWVQEINLTQPSVHPLMKIAAVLGDLEAWHASRGDQEAALEARLERLRRLYDADSDKDRRTLFRRDLEEQLPRYESVPWWAMGMGTLARFQQQAGMLVRAHETASRGQVKYPQSPGGQLCLSILKSIEAPDFSLQAMSHDGRGRRSIAVEHRNLKALWFRAWPVDLEQRIASARDYNLLPASHEQLELLKQKPAAEWTVELPATPDYASHRTYVTPPLEGKGLYVVLASARQDFSQQGNRILGLNFILTDLALVARAQGGAQEFTVLEARTGEQVPSAEVRLYQRDYNQGHKLVESRRTGAQGQVRFEASDRRHGWGFFFLARRGKDLALDEQSGGFYPRGEPSSMRSALVYTDRSIYRPLQKLYWKVVAFEGRGDQARYRVLPQAEVTVSLMDANHQVVEQKTVQTNAYGSASGEFTLPTGRLLGNWHLSTSPSGRTGFRVEEYKRPTFEASLKEPEGALRLNRPATFKGEARYYFGLPVVAGNVRWRVTREPVYPWWWGWWGRPLPGATQAQVIANGTSTLEAEGSFRLTFTPEAEEPRRKEDKALSYNYRVTAEVTDEGGETRTAERSFRLGWVSVEAQLGSEQQFLLAGQPGAFNLVRSDLNGTPRPGQGTWRVVALKQPAQALMPADQPVPSPEGERAEGQPRVATEGDKLQPRWQVDGSYTRLLSQWEDGAEVARGEATHGEQGEARLELAPLQPGAYRLRYETVDDFGERYETFRDFLVAGEQVPLEVPAVLQVQQGSAQVGDTANVLVHSGFAGQPLYLEVYRAGKRVSLQELRGRQSPALLRLPVREEDRGGFTLVLVMMRDHQLLRFSESVFVPWSDKELKLEFATFRDMIRPGARETWRMKVSGPKGANPGAGAAELLAYMYDEALEVFAPHSPPSVLSLYPGRTGEPWLRSTLGSVSGQYVLNSGFASIPSGPSLTPDSLHFYDSYGIGGPGVRYGYGRGKAMRAMRAPSPAMAAAPPPPSPEPAAEADGMADKRKSEQSEAAMSKESLARSESTRGDGKDAAAAEQPLRSNFAETAFWQPHLLTGEDGSVTLEFTVPDSVTGWNVWVHAVTKDLRGGSATRKTRSVKELMVRPYVPRFLREGDRADLKVTVNNASQGALAGQVVFDLIDPETQQSVLADFGLEAAKARVPFTVEPNQGATVSFPLVAPKRPGNVAIRVTATSGNLSDGELRPVPILPSRVHLAQSRFVTLKDSGRRQLTFEDMARGGDPTLVHDQLIVTLDAQLFYTVLQSLPYLVDYPYECTEQTLNRFVSTGILSSLYDEYPAVATMAKKLSTRDVRLETWEAADPNRKLALEETPWLVLSRGGEVREGGELANVLDPRMAQAQRESALAKLRKMQTASGGFPWFPGGPPSPYMTLYTLHGLARAAEYGVEVPKDMTRRTWGYVAQHFREEYASRMLSEDCCWEFLTFLNYVASSFPDASWTGEALTQAERQQILEHSFKHWRQHSPYLKGYLALTLQRMGRAKDAELVWASVMDSAKTTEDQGTFWAAEDRSWLWYNDTIETHAFALRTLTELAPKDSRRHGMVQWLLINKKLNHWKSTRATAEVIYALVKYLEQEGALGVREEYRVEVGPRKASFVFEPDTYTGKDNQVRVPGPEVDAKTMSTITVEKSGKGFAFASATWHFSTDRLPEESRGDFFSVSRSYFKRERRDREVVLKPLAEGEPLAVGDEVEVQLSLRAKHSAEYVHLRDPRAAGFEPENAVSRYKWDLGIYWYEEVRDSGTNFFFEWLPQGEYTFKYRLRVNMAGDFRIGPATVQSMYAPEFNAYSAGHLVRVGR